MLFGFQAITFYKISWKKAVKTLIFFEKAVFLLLRLCGYPVPFVQSKRRGKDRWRSVTFSEKKPMGSVTFIKVILRHGCFSRFLNCTYGTKSHKASHHDLKEL